MMPMTLDDAKKQVGEGWWPILETFYRYIDLLNSSLDTDIDVVAVENRIGMLDITARHPDELTQDIVDKLSWATERDSVRVCEVCGKPGYRRKAIEGSPNRCQPHYIELLTQMAEEE